MENAAVFLVVMTLFGAPAFGRLIPGPATEVAEKDAGIFEQTADNVRSSIPPTPGFGVDIKEIFGLFTKAFENIATQTSVAGNVNDAIATNAEILSTIVHATSIFEQYLGQIGGLSPEDRKTRYELLRKFDDFYKSLGDAFSNNDVDYLKDTLANLDETFLNSIEQFNTGVTDPEVKKAVAEIVIAIKGAVVANISGYVKN